MTPMQSTNFPTYIFATLNPGQTKKTVEELKQNSQIDFIAPVTGRYDLVIRLKQTTPQQVYQTIQSIRQIHGIQSTVTNLPFNGFQNGISLQSQMPLGISLFNVTAPLETFINQLKSFPGLVEAWTVPGQFDIVALWQARTTDEIVKASVEKLPTLQGIARSETLLAPAPFFQA